MKKINQLVDIPKRAAMLLGILCILGITLGWYRSTIHVYAASGNITLEMEEKELQVGDQFEVTVSIRAEEAIHGVDITLFYNTKLLKYLTGSPQISGEDGLLRISDVTSGSNATSITYRLIYEVLTVGSGSIEVGENASIYNEVSSQTMSVASNVLLVSSKSKEEASELVGLKSLKISGGTLTPSFDSDTLVYDVKVDAGVKKIIISAEAQDSDASVKVNEPGTLVVGENEIKIIVTRKNGDTKEYTIYAICEAEEQVREEEETSNDPSEAEDVVSEESKTDDATDVNNQVLGQSISVTSDENDTIVTVISAIKIEKLDSVDPLPSGYKETTVIIDGHTMVAYETENSDGRYVLLYASTNGTDATFYQYDRVNGTLVPFRPIQTATSHNVWIGWGFLLCLLFGSIGLGYVNKKRKAS